MPLGAAFTNARSIAACCLVATCLRNPVNAAPAALAIRATGPQATATLTTFIARNAEPTRLGQSLAGVLPERTPRQVISSLCGSVRRDYYREFVQANQAVIRRANRWPLLDSQPLGTLAPQLVWPSCLYVVKGRVAVEKRRGDTARSIYVRATGGDGTDKALRRFYGSYGKSLAQIQSRIDRIEPGKAVIVPWTTAAVSLKPTLTPANFKVGLQGAAEIDSASAQAMVRSTKIGKPRFVMDVSEDELTRDTTHKCALQGQAPFNANAIVVAYKHTFGAKEDLASSHVGVFVVDNGFFGGSPVGPKYGNAFPAALFQSQRNHDGTFGPVVPVGGGIYPSNYVYFSPNSSIDDIRGHGTHVAGLVLGGTYFSSAEDRKILYREHNRNWFDLSILNIGKGQEEPIENVVGGLSAALQLELEPHDIVNLSIEYGGDDTASDSNASQLENVIRSGQSDLFVVAAGNDRRNVENEAIFPAMQGGASSRNVISVAALDWGNALAFFTNTGRDKIDIGAPGCHIASWIDIKGSVRQLNGTSQATPLVTFAAALVKSLDANLKPLDIKTRLIVSGELVEPKPTTVQPWSLSRLNVPVALYLWDDYLRVTTPHGPREYIGTLTNTRGIGCAGEPNGHNLRDIWSIKRGNIGQYLYSGRRFALPIESPCTLVAVDGATERDVTFQPEYEITGAHLKKISADSHDPVTMSVPLDQLELLVRSIPTDRR